MGGGGGAQRQDEQTVCLSDAEWLGLGIGFQRVRPDGVIKSPWIICLDYVCKSEVEEVAAVARRYAQAKADRPRFNVIAARLPFCVTHWKI
jgi:hypothetical protein